MDIHNLIADFLPIQVITSFLVCLFLATVFVACIWKVFILPTIKHKRK